MIDVSVLMQAAQSQGALIVRRYSNGVRSFPGVEVQLPERPYRLGVRRVGLTPLISLWMQPRAQEFRTQDARLGGLVSVRLQEQQRSGWLPFVVLEGKTAGWVLGSPYLDAGAFLRSGVSVTSF